MNGSDWRDAGRERPPGERSVVGIDRRGEVVFVSYRRGRWLGVDGRDHDIAYWAPLQEDIGSTCSG